LTRKVSDKLPSGVDTKTIDYDNPASIKDALVGQDALIISLSGHAPQGTEAKLVQAAAEAGVKWVLPNEWSPDTAHEGLLKDLFILGPKSKLSQP
jgi:saccharopine dehydrogenase-like NADP-dependent oxidoreductase